MDVTDERAADLLKRCKYEPRQVLAILKQELDEVTYTKTELILKRSGSDRYDAIQRVAKLIESQHNLVRNGAGHVTQDCLSNLNKHEMCVVILGEWLDYEDGEGMSCAVLFWPELVQ